MARPTPESTIFVDPRGGGRALRVTWHERETEGNADSPAGDGLVVLSLWRDNLCVGSFRLPASDVPDLVHALTRGLAAAAAHDPFAGTA